MASEEYLALLQQGTHAWNTWREQHPDVQPDLRKCNFVGFDLSGINLAETNLSGADFVGANLSGANLAEANLSRANLIGTNLNGTTLTKAYLSGANLFEANLSRTNLSKAYLSGANLSGADFIGANLSHADLSEATLTAANFSGADLTGVNLSEVRDLRGANLSRLNLAKADLSGLNLRDANLEGSNLSEANLSEINFSKANLSHTNLTRANLYATNLSETNLSGANLSEANLMSAQLVSTNFEEANLTGCRIFRISAWRLNLEGANQSDLVITPPEQPTIAVDDLEVTQFIDLLLNNQRIRKTIISITSKLVLILGSFMGDRRQVLDLVRDELRRRDYLPVLFNINKPANRDTVEALHTLAQMSRFLIADLTGDKSVLQELHRLATDLPSVPVQPIILASANEAQTLEGLSPFTSVLEPFQYDNYEELIASLGMQVIAPAEARSMALELSLRPKMSWESDSLD